MTLDESLIYYRQGQFTAEDVTRATGLSERSQRELLKIGVLQAAPQAKTKARLLYSRMVKRAAVVTPLNKCGLSLKVAGKIAYADILLESLLFDIIDPIQAIFEPTGEWDPVTKLPPKRKRPDKHGWFDPTKPASAEKNDHFIEIIDGRYASSGAKGDRPRIFGELTPDGTDFIVWYGSVWDKLVEPGEQKETDLPNEFHPRFALGPQLRKFESTKPTETDVARAELAWRNPVSRVSVNVSLTLRVALRRLLYIDPAQPEGSR